VALSQREIVDTAVRLLREQGLQGVTFRKLATELGVSAPTLYWHVESKRVLLDLVAEALVREQRADMLDEPARGQPWWEWLEERARALFDALVSTRDAPSVLAGNRPSPDALPGLERVLRTLVTVGVPPAEAQQTLFAIGSYVIGSAMEWQAEAERARENPPEDAALAASLRTGDYPYLDAAVTGLLQQPPRATFEHGLALLVDGLRARYVDAPSTRSSAGWEPVRR
jgi:TetR/AcrR family transcriptional regulator, tetracycline repressor protein